MWRWKKRQLKVEFRTGLDCSQPYIFTYFHGTVERGDQSIISRELDASAKRETWSSFISLPSPPLRASRSLFLSRTLKNTKVVNSLPGWALVCGFFFYDRLAPLVRRWPCSQLVDGNWDTYNKEKRNFIQNSYSLRIPPRKPWRFEMLADEPTNVCHWPGRKTRLWCHQGLQTKHEKENNYIKITYLITILRKEAISAAAGMRICYLGRIGIWKCLN